mgnify:CR=1 FL=1
MSAAGGGGEPDYRALWLDALADVVAYGGHRSEDGTLDSCGITTVAEAMRTLAEHGCIRIVSEHGRRVIGRWTDA